MADRGVIDSLLAAHGLAMSEEERAQVASLYAALQADVAALYAVTEAHDETPALIFRAAPPLDRW